MRAKFSALPAIAQRMPAIPTARRPQARSAPRHEPDMTDRVRIFDTTLRDGEQSPGCSMTRAQKLTMARALAELGVEGFVVRYEPHLVNWRRLADGDIGIATICTSGCTSSAACARTSASEPLLRRLRRRRVSRSTWMRRRSPARSR